MQGDEGVLREYVRSEITKRNILVLLKSKESKLDRETFSRHLIDEGLIGEASLLEVYASPDLGEVIKKLETWFDLSGALANYRQTGDLSAFEVAMDKLIVERYMSRFRSLLVSLTSTFAFILQSEYERQNIRRITYAKQYGMTEEYIKSVLLVS